MESLSSHYLNYRIATNDYGNEHDYDNNKKLTTKYNPKAPTLN